MMLMGFKLIREKTREHAEKLERLRKIQLDTEVRRWTNMTGTSERKDEFIERFAIVKSKRTKEMSPEKMAESVGEDIKKNQNGLIQAQGNIDIERLMDLLS